MNIQVYTAICGEEYGRRFGSPTDITWYGGSGIFGRPEWEAERYKVLGHKFFPNDEVLVWLDASIRLNCTPEEAVKLFLGDADIAVFKHPVRDCLFQEIKTMQEHPRFKADQELKRRLAAQETHYKDIKFPEHFGLWETGMIIRRASTIVNGFFNDWWSEMTRWHWRGQATLPMVVREYGEAIKFKTIDEGDLRVHPLLDYKESR